MPHDSSKPASSDKSGPRRWYRRKRTYAVFFALAAAGFVLAAALAVKFHPHWAVQEALAAARVEGKFTAAAWQADGSLRIDHFSLGDYLRTERVELRFNWKDLLRQSRIERIDIYGAQLWLGRVPKGGHLSCEVGALRLIDGTILLDNLGPGMPIVPVQVGSRIPLVFNGLILGKAGKSADLNKEQTVTIDHLLITSPFDALSPVLEFAAINVTFTWAELFENQIRALQMLGPKIYLGPDLFWFVDQFQKKQPVSSTVSKPMVIDHVDIQGGQLAINAFGQPGVTLPFYFMSQGRNARIDRLDQLPLSVKIVIPPQDRFYEAYKVSLKQMRGQIDFALPLTQHDVHNVVPTIYFDEVSWNDLAATKAWSSLTFDKTGIYGKLGGECYGGYLNGEFSVLFESGFPWRGSFFASKVGVGPITDKIAAKYLSLDGTLDGKLEVEGRSTEIVRSTASLKLEKAGHLEIKSIDELMGRIPPSWNFIKRDLAKIFLESFRAYDYTAGEMSANYGLPDSVATLTLRGAQGARAFNVNWHQTPDGPGAVDVRFDPADSNSVESSVQLQTSSEETKTKAQIQNQ